MQVHNYLPAGPLRQLIRTYLISSIDNIYLPIFGSEHKLLHYEEFLPNQRQVIILDLDAHVYLKKAHTQEFSKKEFMTIPGVHLKKIEMCFAQNYKRNICIIFWPGGLHRLLGFSMEEISEKDFSGHDLLGSDTNLLVEHLNATSTPTAQVNILDQYFMQKLHKISISPPVDLLMQWVEQQPAATVSVDHILKNINKSVRQLERIFLQRFGIPPKTYLKLMRFNQAKQLKDRRPNLSWTQIAYELGYFDQMHLIRDFKAFTDHAPSKAPFSKKLITDVQGKLFQHLD